MKKYIKKNRKSIFSYSFQLTGSSFLSCMESLNCFTRASVFLPEATGVSIGVIAIYVKGLFQMIMVILVVSWILFQRRVKLNLTDRDGEHVFVRCDVPCRVDAFHNLL